MIYSPICSVCTYVPAVYVKLETFVICFAIVLCTCNVKFDLLCGDVLGVIVIKYRAHD